MKSLPKIKISDDLNAQLILCFEATPPELAERIREALAEPAEATNAKRFAEAMTAIVNGR